MTVRTDKTSSETLLNGLEDGSLITVSNVLSLDVKNFIFGTALSLFWENYHSKANTYKFSLFPQQIFVVSLSWAKDRSKYISK